MNLNFLRSICIAAILCLVISCDKNKDGMENEVWPKEGYLLTINGNSDTVYMEYGNMVNGRAWSARFPLDDITKKWKISPEGGGAVAIHNSRGEFWTVDSIWHPGLNVEQFYIRLNSGDRSGLTDHSKFRYHKSADGNSFYIESVKYPQAFVTALGHAGSGRGLRLQTQSSPNWNFWLSNQ